MCKSRERPNPSVNRTRYGSHLGPVGGTRYIFANRAKAPGYLER